MPALLISRGRGQRAGRLLHADLHNHTVLSDGDGWAEDAFASMRAAGLDVAAITDHAFGISEPAKTIDHDGWRKLGKLADAADDPGQFVAVRGFEWSSPSLGHINVWGSRSFVEPLPLRADGVPAGREIADEGPPGAPAAIVAFYDWLATLGGDELVSFNHPGRETGRFGLFRYDPRLAERMVALEMFNRGDDYLFERVDTGTTSPLVACLDAGWRVGLIGVTDEHRERWGFHEGLGRTGLWARSRDRSGIRDAMLRRRMFATRERDLRVDATVNGVPMGGTLPLAHAGTVKLRLEFGAGPDWTGHPLRLQVLQSGSPLPAVVAELDFPVPREKPVTWTARVDPGHGGWLVLRISDPARPADRRAAGFADYRSAGRTIAYLSPFFLDARPS
jgi:hypothetical protein